MECIGCPIISICKSYENLSAIKAHANVTISNCEIKALIISNNNIVQANVPMSTTPKIARDFSEVSRKASEKQKEKENLHNKVVVKTEDVNLPLVKIECPTCHGTTTEDDLSTCWKCGKVICSNCGTEATDPNAKEGEHISSSNKLCEECWSK